MNLRQPVAFHYQSNKLHIVDSKSKTELCNSYFTFEGRSLELGPLNKNTLELNNMSVCHKFITNKQLQ